MGYMPFDLAVWSHHVRKLTKRKTFDDGSILLIFNRSSFNALIMKLGQLAGPVKWSLLVYSLFPIAPPMFVDVSKNHKKLGCC